MRGTIEDRFLNQIVLGTRPACRPDLTRCWLWTGALYGGYGHLWCDGKQLMVHRFIYELVFGPILFDLEIDHLCRVRNCVNPSHMEAVTNKVNVLRGVSFVAVNALKTHCKRGHPFDEENTYVYKTSRVCRSCNRERCKLFEREKRARIRLACTSNRKTDPPSSIYPGQSN